MRGIIHIGAEKTGTTALQEFFTMQRKHLRSHGITYPGFAGHRQHSMLAFYCMDPARENHQTRMNPALSSSQRDQWKQKFRASVCRELMSSGGSVDLLVSTELFHSKLASCEEILRLKSLLDLWCEDYRVVFYMRRQDELAVSLYSTYLRTGGSRHDVLQPRAEPIHYYDYERILGRWEQVFGTPRIIPRLFDKAEFVDGDLVSDFFCAAGLGQACLDRERPPRRNTALSRKSQVLLLKLNQRLPDAASPEERQRQQRFRRQVADLLETTRQGPSARPSRSEALAFYEPYRAGNARVAAKWFGRDNLFEEDFGSYPLEADPLDGTDIESIDRLIDELLRIACCDDSTRHTEGVPEAVEVALMRILTGIDD